MQELVRARRVDQATRGELMRRIDALSTLLTTRQDLLERLATRLDVGQSTSLSDGQLEYTAEIETDTEELRRFVLANGASSRTIVLRVDDRVDGQKQQDLVVERKVVELLHPFGIRVYSPEEDSTAPIAEGSQQLSRAEADAADYLSRWVTDVRVVTERSENNDGIISYRSRATIAVVNAETREIRDAMAPKPVRGFGLTDAKAADEARYAVAEEIAVALRRLAHTNPVRLALVTAANTGLRASIEQALRASSEFRVVSVQHGKSGTRFIVESDTGSAALLAYLQERVPELTFGEQISSEDMPAERP